MDYHSFLILIIVALCFICGCTSAPAAESTPAGVGITDITLPAEDERISLAYALQDLAVADSEGFPNTANLTIHQITGENLDLTGNASTWILGVTTQDNATAILIYHDFAWKSLSWQGNFITPAIDLDAVLSPNDLFAAQDDTVREMLEISNRTEISLELSDGVYRITSKNGSRLSGLSFNADTGELVPSE